MSEKIYRYHRNAIAVGVVVFQYVVGVGILRAEVLAETQCLRLKPRLLKLYQHEFQTAVVLAHLCAEIDAEHRYFVSCAVGVFMLTHFNLGHLPLQKGRKHSLGNAVVLHEVFEDCVIYRVCNTYYHSRFFSLDHCKDNTKKRTNEENRDFFLVF